MGSTTKLILCTLFFFFVTGGFLFTSTAFAGESETAATEITPEEPSYKITTSVNSKSYGSISESCVVPAGDSITITATPKAGYYLSNLFVDGVSIGAFYAFTFAEIDKSHTIKAVFSKTSKIMLDAGHAGKYNRSPVYPSYYESNMTWALHTYLKDELLKYNGFQVGVTRNLQKTEMEVYSRGKASSGYNLFLSLHSNATSSSSTDYPLIITQKGDTNHSLAKALGQSIQTTMATKQKYKTWQRLNQDGKTEYYGVLRGSKSAGTLGMIVEHSFHTNLAATKWLSDQENLKKMARVEAEVIAKYYKLQLRNDTTPINLAVMTNNQYVKVLVNNLNIQESYYPESKIIGKAKKNKIYQLKAKTQNGEWGQLKSNGCWFYLKNGSTKVVKVSKTVASKEKRKVLIKKLNMRKSYSGSSKIMGHAKKNKVYQLKAKTRNGAWGQLKTNGYWIYLKRGYTKKV